MTPPRRNSIADEQFLHEARTMTMSTLQAGGTIHSVAVWYGFLHERVGPRRGELQVGADGVHERDLPVGSGDELFVSDGVALVTAVSAG
jgi:hypothetical protein